MKILIVDDETQILLELPKAFLKFYPDAIIDTAWSYIKAEELLKENIYGIILLDGQISDHITDPWQHGFGYCLVEPIRNSNSNQAKIIMISTDNQMSDEGISRGADFKISKNEFFRRGKVVNSLDLNLEVFEGL